MALKPIVESLEGLPADVSKEYTEKDGKFILQVETVGTFGLHDIAPLKKTIETLRGEEKKYKENLAKFEGITDPEEARTAMEKYKQFKDWDPDKKIEEQVQARLAEPLKKSQAEIAKRDAEIERMNREADDGLIDRFMSEAAVKHKVKSVKLLKAALAGEVQVRKLDNGRKVIEVLDSNGNPRTADDGRPMGLEQRVVELKAVDEFAGIFEGSGASGSGGAGGSGTGAAGRGAGSGRTVDTDSGIITGVNPEDLISGKVTIKSS